MKETIKYYLPFVLGAIIIVLLFMRSCESKPVIMPKEPDTKKTQIDIDSVKLLKAQNKLLQDNARTIDSIGRIHKAKYLALKETNRTALQHHICDTIEVLKYYDNTVANCDSIIQSDSLIIATDKSIMVLDQSIIRKQSDIINEVQEHDNWQKSINDILKKEVKKQKRTKIAVIVGAIVGVVGTVFLLR